MIKNKAVATTQAFEIAAASQKKATYVLCLYVTGMTDHSRSAIDNIKKICETHLQGHYTLDVIDIFQQPELAKDAQIIAIPTLIKQLPLPLRRIIGEMSDTDRVLVGLGLRENPS